MGMIKAYQATLSYDHGLMGKIFPNTSFCRYTPTCSEYGYESISEYGAFEGGYRATRRVLRCNAWSTHDHYDPVPKNENKKWYHKI